MKIINGSEWGLNHITSDRDVLLLSCNIYTGIYRVHEEGQRYTIQLHAYFYTNLFICLNTLSQELVIVYTLII